MELRNRTLYPSDTQNIIFKTYNVSAFQPRVKCPENLPQSKVQPEGKDVRLYKVLLKIVKYAYTSRGKILDSEPAIIQKKVKVFFFDRLVQK